MGDDVALYLISYDLIKPEKDYPDLTKCLKGLGAKKVLYSEWFLSHDDTSCGAIYDYVAAEGKIDSDDKLLVVEVSDWVATETIPHLKTFL